MATVESPNTISLSGTCERPWLFYYYKASPVNSGACHPIRLTSPSERTIAVDVPVYSSRAPRKGDTAQNRNRHNWAAGSRTFRMVLLPQQPYITRYIIYSFRSVGMCSLTILQFIERKVFKKFKNFFFERPPLKNTPHGCFYEHHLRVHLFTIK